MTCQSLISDLSGVESPSVATQLGCISSVVFRAMALGSWRCTQTDLRGPLGF